MGGRPLTLSVVIPVHNEVAGIGPTVMSLHDTLTRSGVPFEILVVNDHSMDGTARELERLSAERPHVRWMDNPQPQGFGYAIRTGLGHFAGDAVCIMMGDGSDDPADVVIYHRALQEGYECVFGSRFMRGSRVVNYPAHKLVLNRLMNGFIRLLFGFRYNDTTNAFKCYRREVIDGVRPILACHFNLTVELPLKAMVRGYTYAVVPIGWRGRETGVSKLKLKEMGSRYMFIVLHVFLEKLLSHGDYRRQDRPVVKAAKEDGTVA